MKLKKIFKDDSGSVYTDAIVSTMLWAALLAIGLTSLGAMAKKFTLITAASDVKCLIEVDGKYDSAEQQKISAFLSGANVHATVSVSPAENYYSLGDTFTVTLSGTSQIGAGGIRYISMPVSAKASGVCEVYLK